MQTKSKLRITLWWIIIAIIAIVLYYKTLSTNWPTNITTNQVQEACIQDICFKIEIADTKEKRQLWLMHRKSLPEDKGMLFVFEQYGMYSFWMKNTLIPLDMIWLDNKQTIIDIKEAEPCTQDPCPTYNPQWYASYVLELNQGISKKYWFKIGDKVEIK